MRSTCEVEGCERHTIRNRRLCDLHRKRKSRHGDVGPPHRLTRPGGQCEVEACADRSYALGLCRTHYWRQQRHGDAHTVLQPRAYPAPVRGAAVELLQAGVRGVEIAARLGVTSAAVYSWRAEEGLPPRGIRRHPDEVRRRALELLAQGRGVTEVARALDLPPTTVSGWRTGR